MTKYIEEDGKWFKRVNKTIKNTKLAQRMYPNVDHSSSNFTIETKES